ncbi:hypothetical protein OSB04_031483 [Centaurea solstitialis]|uniref:Ceramide glucosyltransferase n=1 Tax=Centaurea solstitialis TaxID=347529 RepID=A0AA38SM86_9ASTR|nr:hypothetical protein OSB04_031483 [Centaurea solstitialis]
MDVTPVIESLDAFLFFASRTFCTPFAIFIQIQIYDASDMGEISECFIHAQGCVICLLLAAGFASAAYVRGREIWQMKKSMRAGNSFAFLCHDIYDLEHSKQENLPGVTVVMPLKGSGESNVNNWRSQLSCLVLMYSSTQITSLYGGPLEFLFTVESTADPAYHAISRLLIDFEGDLDASIIIAGPSTTCSQKIHNQYWNYLQRQTFVLESYTTFENWMINRVLLCTHCYLSWGFVAPYVMAVVHVVAACRLWLNEYFLEEHIFDTDGLTMTVSLAICTVIELLSMWNLTRIEIQLCNMLSPEEPPLSLKTYKWSLVFVAMLVDNFLYPISAIRTCFFRYVNWSGTRYHLRKGKVEKIDRKKKGRHSDVAAKRVFSKKGGQEKSSVLSSLSRSFRWRKKRTA